MTQRSTDQVMKYLQRHRGNVRVVPQSKLKEWLICRRGHLTLSWILLLEALMFKSIVRGSVSCVRLLQ